MKKSLTFLIAFICCITLTTYAQIPNSGFENWTSGDPDNWATSNAFPAGLVNITQTTDSHTGSFAVRGDVIDFFGTAMGPVIQSGPGATGFAISEQYHSLELYYKFTSIGGDKFSVNVGLEKAGNAIAQGAVALPSTVNTYTHLTVPLNYMTSDVPDLAIIQILITGPVTGSDVHVGSVMFVDDLLFSLSAGIENISGSDLMGKCYPNPSSDVLYIPLFENVSGEVTLTVIDTYGKEVKKMAGQSQQFGTNIFQFSVEDLSSGLYFYSINGQNRHYQGKFTVCR
ncbi:MAG: T9SS type A sorting domain-containing protein [Bacteroidetes bacterium]|nr:T9SS type A sorting domain-containing protein [Bacteroidota bacterium]